MGGSHWLSLSLILNSTSTLHNHVIMSLLQDSLRIICSPHPSVSKPENMLQYLLVHCTGSIKPTSSQKDVYVGCVSFPSFLQCYKSTSIQVPLGESHGILAKLHCIKSNMKSASMTMQDQQSTFYGTDFWGNICIHDYTCFNSTISYFFKISMTTPMTTNKVQYPCAWGVQYPSSSSLHLCWLQHFRMNPQFSLYRLNYMFCFFIYSKNEPSNICLSSFLCVVSWIKPRTSHT